MMKRYDINQCALYKCRSKKRLALLLKIDLKDLNNLSSIIRYHSFERPKKDGTNRKITAPDKQLKRIQKRILILLSKVIRPQWLISGEKGKCYIDNARSHQMSSYCLTMDIKKFYPNCSREYVYQFFAKRLETSADIAKLLSDIVTYNHEVPTGCPTSQLIAYYAYERMFDEINNIAIDNNCIFTLYVDDMTFSSNISFDPKRIQSLVNATLRKYGHKAKISKTKYYRPTDYKLITGVCVSPQNELRVSNNQREKIIYNFQPVKHNQSNEKSLQSLQGQIQAAKNVEADIFPEIERLTKLAACKNNKNKSTSMV